MPHLRPGRVERGKKTKVERGNKGGGEGRPHLRVGREAGALLPSNRGHGVMIGLEREIRDVNEKFKTERVSRKEVSQISGKQ